MLCYYRCTSEYYTIIVLDVNEHSPIFDKNEYQTTISEKLTVGQAIISVNAEDYDSNNEPCYFNNEVSLMRFKIDKCLF